MIRLHHLEESRSQRTRWLLEELGLDYELVPYARDPETRRAPASLRSVHPLGKSPVIEDGELVLAESGAIAEYLIERYGEGRLAPAPGAPERARYLYWTHFAEGSGMFPLLLDLLLGFAGEGAEALSIAMKAEIAGMLDFMEAEIAGREFFAGPGFTAADIAVTFVLQFAASRGLLEGRPGLEAFLGRMQEREAYQRAAAPVG